MKVKYFGVSSWQLMVVDIHDVSHSLPLSLQSNLQVPLLLKYDT